MTHLKLFVSLCLSSLLLMACTHFNEDRADQFQSLTQDQQSQYWQAKKIESLMQQLESLGVAVYVEGDEYQILIPASLLFNEDTPQLSDTAKPVFNAVSALINAQSTPAVRILAYTNKNGSTRRNLALSQSWAASTLDQLRQQGLLVGLLSAQGHGKCDTIGKNNSLTNRIEIRYRISHGN